MLRSPGGSPLQRGASGVGPAAAEAQAYQRLAESRVARQSWLARQRRAKYRQGQCARRPWIQAAVADTEGRRHRFRQTLEAIPEHLGLPQFWPTKRSTHWRFNRLPEVLATRQRSITNLRDRVWSSSEEGATASGSKGSYGRNSR